MSAEFAEQVVPISTTAPTKPAASPATRPALSRSSACQMRHQHAEQRAGGVEDGGKPDRDVDLPQNISEKERQHVV